MKGKYGVELRKGMEESESGCNSNVATTRIPPEKVGSG
jgi:hypothetical protein